MDDNNTNRFVNQVDIEEAPGFKSRLERIKKQFKGIPEKREMRLIARFNGKELGDANASFRELTRNWNHLQRKTAGGSFYDS